MARFCIATMDSKVGWETQSPQAALARHTTIWFQARENQGKVLGGVDSFYMLFQKYNREPEKMLEKTKESFKLYLEQQFDNVIVETDRQNVTGSVNNYRLIMTARVVVDGVKYDLAETILVTGEMYKVLDSERLKR